MYKTKKWDEAAEMLEALIKKGVPARDAFLRAREWVEKEIQKEKEAANAIQKTE